MSVANEGQSEALPPLTFKRNNHHGFASVAGELAYICPCPRPKNQVFDFALVR